MIHGAARCHLGPLLMHGTLRNPLIHGVILLKGRLSVQTLKMVPGRVMMTTRGVMKKEKMKKGKMQMHKYLNHNSAWAGKSDAWDKSKEDSNVGVIQMLMHKYLGFRV